MIDPFESNRPEFDLSETTNARPASPAQSDHIGRYRINKVLGEGGFGAVYRAYQPLVGREVAIKVILPQYANEPDFIRRFESEAHFGVGLADAGKDDALRRAAGAQGAEEFAAGSDIDAGAVLHHQPGEVRVGVGLD